MIHSSSHRRRLVTLLAWAGLACCASGCEVGHSWFQMDSNSTTPSFGLDLLPRRRSADLRNPADMQERFVNHESSGNQTIHSAEQNASGWKSIHLPTVKQVWNVSREEVVSLEGPQAPFAR